MNLLLRKCYEVSSSETARVRVITSSPKIGGGTEATVVAELSSMPVAILHHRSCPTTFHNP